MAKRDISSIIYINFAPYTNSGNILDYLLENFNLVALFTFNYHYLYPYHNSSRLQLYKNNNLIYDKKLFSISTKKYIPSFFLLFHIAVISLQILFYSIYIRYKFSNFDYFFSVNAFIAWVGNILRSAGFVRKTVYWVWDYYPTARVSKLTSLIRKTYWIFDTSASLHSDKIIFLNKKLLEVRKKLYIFQKKSRMSIVPIGTNPQIITHPKLDPLKIVHFGVLKKSHGLEMIFRSWDTLSAFFPKIEIHIIGSGPDEQYYKIRAGKSKDRIKFYGFVQDDEEVDKIISKCHIGIALYLDESDSVTAFTDPSKVKRYISSGLPVITTTIPDFSKEIAQSDSGVVLHSIDNNTLIDAMNTIKSNYSKYSQNAYLLARKYYYKNIYRQLFD